MKISKIAFVTLFAAGFLTASASASMATSCAVGYVAVEGEFPDAMYTCEPIEAVDAAVDNQVDVKPIESCWTNEDGSEVCTRGITEPMPVSIEDLPIDSEVCDPVASGLVDSEGNTPENCWYEVVPNEVSGEEGEGAIVDDGTVDETLMFQSGVSKSTAATNDQTASNTLAAFGVLVGALGALGIAISRQKETK